MKRETLVILICLGLALATGITFEQVRLNDFVTFDDGKYVTENAQVRSGITGASVVWAFTTTYFYSPYPITWLSHMLDAQLYGLNPAGHHLTSLLLHILSTLLVFGLLSRMTARLWPSAFVAAFFALHPLHVEPVAWASERKELLSIFFGLLAMWAYVDYARSGSIRRYLLTMLFFALGLMAKPVFVTLPLLLLLLDYWPLERIDLDTVGWRRTLVRLVTEKLPLLCLSLISSLVILPLHRSSIGPADAVPMSLLLSNAFVSYARYIGKMIWPSGLAVLYQHPNLPGGTPWMTWQVAGAALLLLLISALVLWAARRRYGLVGWLWFLGTLVPVIGLVQVGQHAMADRYTYLPLIGLFIIVVWGAADLISYGASRGAWVRRSIPCLGAAALMVLAVCSRAQVRTWRSSETLYRHALQVSPSNPTLHNNLGVVLGAEGRLDEAIAHYHTALEIWSAYPMAHNNLAGALRQQGEIDRAIEHYREALRLDPGYAEAHNNLGVTRESRGELEEAVRHYRDALRLDPDLADAHINLGNVLASQGQLDAALESYRQALRVNPYLAETHYNLGVALGLQGRTEEAVLRYGEALRLEPDFADAHFNLANALVARGRLEEAIGHYREALRLKPDAPGAHYNLGNALASLGQREASMRQYREALRFDPEYAEAHFNLANGLLAQGLLDKAIRHYRDALRIKPDFEAARQNLDIALKVKQSPGVVR